MNLLEKQVLRLIGEDPSSPDVFLDTDAGMAPVREALSDAIQEIVMLTGSYKRQYFIPLRAKQGFYRIMLNNGHFGWVTDAGLVNKKRRLEQTGILRLLKHDPQWMITSADPRAYFQIGTDVIAVYPKPSASSDVLELTIVEIPNPYKEDTDRVKLKTDFHYAAVHFAVAEYWASRGDVQEAKKHWGLYLDVLGLRGRFDQTPHSPQRLKTEKANVPQETT